MSPEDIRRVEVENAGRKQNYRAMQGEGMNDLLQWLRSHRDSAMRSAAAERDNDHKRSLYLQESLSYGTVVLHLETMLSLDE